MNSNYVASDECCHLTCLLELKDPQIQEKEAVLSPDSKPRKRVIYSEYTLGAEMAVE